MKTKFIALGLLLAGLTLGHAAEGEKVKAPNGGRIIESIKPRAEFLVTADKKVEVRFIDDSGKAVAPGAQTVTVTMGDRTKPTKLAFTKDGDKLVSDKIIAEGKNLPVVVQIKATPDAKTVSEKFNLNLDKCSTCENAEYACSCPHGEDTHNHKPGEKHDH